MNIIDELSWRGAVNQMTDEEGLRKLTEEKSVSLYCGVDPTGDSMHIGHLIPFMMLKRFALAGHHPYVAMSSSAAAQALSAIRAAARRNGSCRRLKKSMKTQKN